MQRGWWLAAAALVLGATVGRAEEQAPGPAGSEAETRRAEPLVVTATKTETSAAELGASVSVLLGEDFALYHFPSVDEALRAVPGLDVRRSGGPGKNSAISIRGASANQVQLLVDGVRVKSPTLGQGDLSDLSPDLIDRIEVIRGPQSTLYGADAIGGVVNVITKRGQGPFTASVEGQAGNYDTLVGRISLSGGWAALDYALAASHRESGGQFRNDRSAQDALSAQAGISLPGQSRVGLVLRWSRTETGLPVKFVCCGPLPRDPVIDVNQQQQSETLLVSLEGSTHPVPWWESRLRLSRYQNSLGFQDAPDPGFPADFLQVSRTDVVRQEVEWVNAFHAGRWSTTTLGLEYRHEEGANRGNLTRFDAEADVRALFLEQALRFWQSLFVTGGLRVEDHSQFGTEVTGRGGLAWLIKTTGTRLRASAGSGFRAPTLNDLFFPGFSNPDLRPERSVSWDVGVDQSVWRDRVRLGLTWFENRFEDLIRFVSVPDFPFVAVVNVARARTWGLEASAEMDLLRTLAVTLAYTYTGSEDLETGRPLPREARQRATFGLTWEPVRPLSLWGQVHVRSSQLESAAAGFSPGWTRVDVGGTWRIVERWGVLRSLELIARVQNLLDARHAEVRGFPALGINALAGLRAGF